jgi:glutathione S-transferase
MHFKLVSLDICPFVQRSVITLRHKGLGFELEYIDLESPPDWFKAISPLGKVPVLVVDRERVLFESAVINEFIDDVTPPLIKPSDPFQLALNRSWIEYGSNCLSQQYQWMMAADRETFDRLGLEIKASLERIESVLDVGPWFNGPDFSLVDTAYAPLLMRYLLLGAYPMLDAAWFPKTAAWADALLALPEVQQSVPVDFADRFFRNFGRHSGFGPRLFAKSF